MTEDKQRQEHTRLLLNTISHLAPLRDVVCVVLMCGSDKCSEPVVVLLLAKHEIHSIW